MTITTLSYIHDLLVNDHEKKRLAAKWQRELWLSAEENDAGNTDELHRIYENLRQAELAAYQALQDFETHEFR